MRAYVLTTGTIFGLLVLVHVWRAFAESHLLVRDPWYVVVTALSAALCLWAWRLLRGAARS